MPAKRVAPILGVLCWVVACSHGSTGMVVGRIVPGGVHLETAQVGGTVRAIDSNGNVVATVSSSATDGFRLNLSPGRYRLVASVDGTPCLATVEIKVGKTVHTSVTCQGK